MPPSSQNIQYCNHCSKPVTLAIPKGDNRPRHLCPNCGHIQYQNPKIVGGCIPTWNNQILLCRRAIEPRHGLWTLPAGFMENGETLEHCAARETQEEACAEITNQRLYAIYSLPNINQVYVMFTASLTAPDRFAPGPESLDTRLFTPDQIPWDRLAFRVIHRTLTRYLTEQPTGTFTITIEDIL